MISWLSFWYSVFPVVLCLRLSFSLFNILFLLTFLETLSLEQLPVYLHQHAAEGSALGMFECQHAALSGSRGRYLCYLGNMSDALQNLMMQHANTQTFLKHYLLRHVGIDTQAIIQSLEPQEKLMKAVYQISRLIDPQQPQHLTTEQSLSVNKNPYIHSLIEVQNKLKLSLKCKTTGSTEY